MTLKQSSMLKSYTNTAKTKYPQAYTVQQHQASGRMPVLTRDHLALRLRQNWMAKYPFDTCSNGGTNLDDSLTSLNWLQNLNILKIGTPTPPSSPGPALGDYRNIKVNPNSILNVACRPPPTKMYEMRFPDTPPITPTTLGGDSIDYKTNPYVKPPYSYATLICMAMKETKKTKITLSAIYNWITDNFMYYRLADPSWQNSIRHNLSLNKCFQKVPRRKDEPGKGGFWRINPEYSDLIENGVFKKRRNSRDGQSSSSASSPDASPVSLKRIKQEPEHDGYLKRIKQEPDSDGYGEFSQPTKVRRLEDGNTVLHFGAQEDDSHLKGDFNWTSILNQDIEIGGIRIKTEDLIDTNDADASPLIAMSPPSSDSNSVSDLGLDDFLGENDLSPSESPLDFTTSDPLSLEVVGTGIKAPDWWADSLNAGETRGLLQNIENLESRSGLNTPVAPSPVNDNDFSDHPWFDRAELNGETPFDVDDLFDIENIPSPAV